MNIKIIVLIAALIFSGINTQAQEIFDKYSDNKDVTYVSIKPKMFQLLAKLDIEADDPEAQDYLNMVESITNFKTLVTYNDAISKDIDSWVKSRQNKLEELMEVNDDGTQIKFYVKEGRDKDIVNELLMYVDGLDNKLKGQNITIGGKERDFKTVLVYLEGNIDLNQISKLTKQMKLSANDKSN